MGSTIDLSPFISFGASSLVAVEECVISVAVQRGNVTSEGVCAAKWRRKETKEVEKSS